MTDPLRELGIATEHQLPAVLHDGNFFLVACPGSGKTRTGGVRFARLVDDGRRVAATSYTNIGVRQIREIVSGLLGIAIGPENFVGTLHAFLLRFVFYPFGHLVMGCTTAPTLISDDAGWDDVVFGDHRVRAPVSRFRFRPDGTLTYRGALPRGLRTHEEAADRGQARALELKLAYARRGFVSMDDSMYWSLRVLHDHPQLAAAAAARFEELQIDEAQDTSELQLGCVHELAATGRLESLVLIGDTEQSIFSFQGASPEGCRSLAAAHGLEVITLSENHRSSQLICDVAVRFCAGRDAADNAVGETAGCTWSPEVFLYDPERPHEAIEHFRARLQDLDIDESDCAVLARGNTLVDELNRQSEIGRCEPRPLALGRAAAAVQGTGTPTRKQIEAVDRALAYAAWDTSDLNELEAEQRRELRTVTVAVLSALPAVDGPLQAWIRNAATVVASHLGALADAPAHTAGMSFRSSADQAAVAAADVFASLPQRLRAQTVHDVKGASRDAVLVVADRVRSTRHDPQGELWSRPLRGEEIAPDQEEELRIVFVALTRARRYCAVALPANTSSAVLDLFTAAGFVRPGDH